MQVFSERPLRALILSSLTKCRHVKLVNEKVRRLRGKLPKETKAKSVADGRRRSRALSGPAHFVLRSHIIRFFPLDVLDRIDNNLK